MQLSLIILPPMAKSTEIKPTILIH